MQDHVMHNVMYLFQAQDTLETDAGEPVSCDNIELLKEILDDTEIYAGRNPSIKELRKILTNPHFKVKNIIVTWLMFVH